MATTKPEWPSTWSASDAVELSRQGLRITYTGRASDCKPLLGGGSVILFGDAISVRSDVPVPVAFMNTSTSHSNPVYYFELQARSLILGGTVAIGLTTNPKETHLGPMPGWSAGSYGLHSDGEIFSAVGLSQVGRGRCYGPPFGVNEVVGCGFAVHSGEIFFTLNGVHLGTAFQVDVTQFLDPEHPVNLFPIVGMDSTGSVLDVNFGTSSFLWEGDTFNVSLAPVSTPGGAGTGSAEVYESEGTMLGDSEDDEEEESAASAVARRDKAHKRVPSNSFTALVSDKANAAAAAAGFGSLEDVKRVATGTVFEMGEKIVSFITPNGPDKQQRELDRTDRIEQDLEAVQSSLELLTELSQAESSSPDAQSPPTATPSDSDLSGDLKHDLAESLQRIHWRLVNMIRESGEESILQRVLGLHDRLLGTMNQASPLLVGEDLSFGEIASPAGNPVTPAPGNQLTTPAPGEEIENIDIDESQVEIATAEDARLHTASQVARSTSADARDARATSADAQLGDIVVAADDAKRVDPITERLQTLQVRRSNYLVPPNAAQANNTNHNVQGSNINSPVQTPVKNTSAGGNVANRTSFAQEQSTSSTDQLLSMLRAGSEKEQINALIALAHVVNTPDQNVHALDSGAMYILIRLSNGARAAGNRKFKYHVSRAIASIISNSCLPVEQLVASTHQPAKSDMNPKAITLYFERELSDIVSALGFLLEERDASFANESVSADVTGAFPSSEDDLNTNQNLFVDACMKHLVALSFANLCLMFSTRDNVKREQSMASPFDGYVTIDSRGEAHDQVDFYVDYGTPSTSSHGGEEFPRGYWALKMAEEALPYLISICSIPFPNNSAPQQRVEKSKKNKQSKSASFSARMNSMLFSGANEWQEARRLAAFAIARIAQHQKARAPMIGNVFPCLVKMLRCSDSELVLHSVTAVAALCSEVDGQNSVEWTDRMLAPRKKYHEASSDFTLGYITAQVISSNALEPLLQLAQEHWVTEGVRCWVSAALASLAMRPPARERILALNGIRAILNLARLSLQMAGSISASSGGERSSSLSSTVGNAALTTGDPVSSFTIRAATSSTSIDSLVDTCDLRSSSSTTSVSSPALRDLRNPLGNESPSQASDSVAANGSTAVQADSEFNARNTELRRRLSHRNFGLDEVISRQISRSHSKEDNSAGSGGQRSSQNDVHQPVKRPPSRNAGLRERSLRMENQRSVSFPSGAVSSSTIELRYVAAALFNLLSESPGNSTNALAMIASGNTSKGGNSDTRLPSHVNDLISDNGLEILTSLCANTDPLVQLYSVRAVALLADYGPKACHALIESGVAPVLMILMTKGLDSGSDVASSSTLSSAVAELRMQSGVTLGNLANADMSTRYEILQSGCVTRIVRVIKGLIKEDTSDKDGIPERTLNSLDIEVLHQAVRTVAGLAECIIGFEGDHDASLTEKDPSVDGPHSGVEHAAARTPPRKPPGNERQPLSPRLGRRMSASSAGRAPNSEKRGGEFHRRQSSSSSNSITLATPEFGRRGEILPLLMFLLQNIPIETVQVEICRAIAAIAVMPGVIGSAHRSQIVNEVLGRLVDLAMGGSNGHENVDPRLKRTAESVIVALGFLGGCVDLQVCGNDVNGLRDWFDMDHAVERQELIDAALHTTIASTWLVPLKVSGLPYLETIFDSTVAPVRGSSGPRRLSTLPAKVQLSVKSPSESDSVGASPSTSQGPTTEATKQVGDSEAITPNAVDSSKPMSFNSTNMRIHNKKVQKHKGWHSKVRRLVSCGPGDFVSEEDVALMKQLENAKRTGARPNVPDATSEAVFIDGEHVAWYCRSLMEYGGREHDEDDASPGSSAPGERPLLLRADEASVLAQRPGTRGLEELPPPWVTLQLNYHFPSLLQRRQMYTPACYFQSSDELEDFSMEALLPSKPRAIILPSRIFFSFRFERVIGRILNKYKDSSVSANGGAPAESSATTGGGAVRDALDLASPSSSQGMSTGHSSCVWSLVLRDSQFFGDFFKRLVDCLYRYPTITSVTIVNNESTHMDECDEALARFLNDLPPRMTWCTFDNVLSKHGVKLISLVLNSKMRCSSLSGLAIRNHGFKEKAMEPIINFLRHARHDDEDPGRPHHDNATEEDPPQRASGTSSESQLSPRASPPQVLSPKRTSSIGSIPHLRRIHLRWIDLSGNNLSDSGCASVIRAISNSECMIESLDLSRNKVGKSATELMDALVGNNTQSTVAEANGMVFVNQSLRELHLAQNGLGPTAVSRLLLALGSVMKIPCRLAVLNLDMNSLNGPDRTHAESALMFAIRNNERLLEIGMCYNGLGAECGAEIKRALQSNSTLHFLRLDGNPNVQHEDLLIIEHILMNNRKTWTAIRTNFAETRAKQAEPSDDVTTGDSASVKQVYEGTDSEVAAVRVGLPTQGEDVVAAQTDDQTATARPSAARQEDSPPSHHTVAHVERGRARSESDKSSRRSGHEFSGASSYGGTFLASSTGMAAVVPRLSVLFSAPLALRDAENNYYPIETLDFETEKEMLWQSFVDGSREIDLSFGYATAERLRSEVTMKCQAIHFSGHGHPEWLSFEDGRGGLHVLTADNVRQLCSAGLTNPQARSANEHSANASTATHGVGDSKSSSVIDHVDGVKLVFVSACFSKFTGEAFVEAGIPHVVCVDVENGKLLDKAAQVFTRAFYLSLAVGNTIRNAFDVARESVAASPTHTPEEQSRKFMLLPEHGNHDVLLFPNCPVVARWPSFRTTAALEYMNAERAHGFWKGSYLPTTAEDFIGRNVDMYQTLMYIFRRRLVAITGASGLGKTTLTVATANYANERNMFTHGVIFIRAERMKSVNEVIHALYNIVVNSFNSAHQTGQPRQGGVSSQGSSRGGNKISPATPQPASFHAYGGYGASSSFGGARGLQSDPNQSERHLDELCSMLRSSKCLILLDHCDGMVAAEYEQLRLFLGRLMDQTKGVRVILTAEKVSGIGGMTHVLPPLLPRDSAKLFVRSSPFNYQLGDLTFLPVGMDPQDNINYNDTSTVQLDLLDMIAQDQRVSVLGGHPRKIGECAYQMSKEEYVSIVEDCRANLAEMRRKIQMSVPKRGAFSFPRRAGEDGR